MNAKIEDPTIANLEIVNQKARIWKIKIGDSNIKRKIQDQKTEIHSTIIGSINRKLQHDILF